MKDRIRDIYLACIVIAFFIGSYGSCNGQVDYLDGAIEMDFLIVPTESGHDTLWVELGRHILIDYQRFGGKIHDCGERGHIKSGSGVMTSAGCIPRIKVTDNHTIRISGGCNTFTYGCEVCGKRISERQPIYRDTIWRRK